MRRLAPLAVLVVAWVLLNGELTVGNVVAGAIAAAVLLALFPLEGARWQHQLHPLGLARFLGFVAVSLVTSSAQVIRTVLRPSAPRLRAGIVRVELPATSPLVVTLVANAISLTPGTLTLTATNEPAVLHVHVLGLGDVEAFRRSVVDLHGRATAAFTPILGGGA
ncbi:MAG: Na+/H+ antiporter subunit E [Acidimicrobiia bacterium]|nr:Na+/H+ antiporter subunit E [Acidimicrobiia bacterium]